MSLGAPNAKVLFPKNSFIDVNSFESYDHLIDYIEYLVENKDFYEVIMLGGNSRFHQNYKKSGISLMMMKIAGFAAGVS